VRRNEQRAFAVVLFDDHERANRNLLHRRHRHRRDHGERRLEIRDALCVTTREIRLLEPARVFVVLGASFVADRAFGRGCMCGARARELMFELFEQLALEICLVTGAAHGASIVEGMRWALVLVSLAGCGDNAPECGHVQLLEANRNIWGGHIAIDDERVYYSDYDNGFGTHLVFRQPRDGGQPLVIAARDEASRFGFGMAVDAAFVYWSAENEPAGYALLATPRLGGRTLELSAISECTATAVAVDAINAYASSRLCNNGTIDVAAKVIAVPHAGGASREVWTSPDADVVDLAARDGVVFIATSAGLVRASDVATELVDGRPTYHAVIAGGELIYSTNESIIARPLAGGEPQTLYTFVTPISEPRAFGVDGTDLYIAEPPQMLFLPRGGEPTPIVRDMGAVITHIVARDGHAYWSTLAVPGSIGLFDTFSGGTMRVAAPCH
jgi:hypothetical protein